jgi:uncharacterized protein (UPF0335 family)
MKKPNKLSLRERNNLIYRNNLFTINKVVRSRKKLTNKKRKEKKSKINNPYNKNSSKTVKKIELPQVFDLYKNTDETLEIMSRFRAIIDKDNPKLKKLSFDKIREIESSSALMLAAEIDVWNIKTNQKLSSNHKSWDENVKHLLCEMGFFELLNIPKPSQPQNSQDATFLQFISGNKSNGESAKKLRENIEKVIGKELESKHHLFDGLSEAFTNTTQHAYDREQLKEFDKWWISASYKKNENQLIISMYDRGKSIPATMHTSTKWLFLDEREITKHSDLIEIAMRESLGGKNTRTQTKQKNRGKGLKQLLDFIKDKGRLTIISNKGYCTFELDNNNLNTITKKELKYKLQGTLIEWRIKL